MIMEDHWFEDQVKKHENYLIEIGRKVNKIITENPCDCGVCTSIYEGKVRE